MNGGPGGGLVGDAKVSAVAVVKPVVLSIHAEIFLVRCKELATPAEVARVATKEAAAQPAGCFVGMQAGTCFSLHFGRHRVLLRQCWHAKDGAP